MKKIPLSLPQIVHEYTLVEIDIGLSHYSPFPSRDNICSRPWNSIERNKGGLILELLSVLSSICLSVSWLPWGQILSPPYPNVCPVSNCPLQVTTHTFWTLPEQREKIEALGKRCTIIANHLLISILPISFYVLSLSPSFFMLCNVV